MVSFTIVEEIESGAFGRVEKVRLADGRLAARKVFAPSREVVRMAQEDLTKLKRRFRREVETQSRLNPDLFMPVLDRDLAAEPPWFIMPLAERNWDAEGN